MSRPTLRLTNAAIQANLKARPEKPTKFSDFEHGLYLLIGPTGKAKWRRDYRYGNKKNTYSIGTYPGVTLAMAREEATRLQGLLDLGKDPAAEREAGRRAAAVAQVDHRFKAVAARWVELRAPGWTESYGRTIHLRLENDVFPVIGAMSLADVTRGKILADVIGPIVRRRALETAQRVADIVSAIYEFAIEHEIVVKNPAKGLRKTIEPPPVVHLPALTDPQDFAVLLQDIDDYPAKGIPVVRWLMQLSALVWTRPTEAREAQWAEFRLDAEPPRWVIPGSRMKGPEKTKVTPPDHIVPLSRQTVELLRAIHEQNGHGKFVFPHPGNAARAISDGAVASALRRMGYATGQMCHHGFRAIASTNLNGSGWDRDLVEVQLAHLPRDGIRASYNHASYLPQRRVMMQAYADWCDRLRQVRLGAAAPLMSPPPPDLWADRRLPEEAEGGFVMPARIGGLHSTYSHAEAGVYSGLGWEMLKIEPSRNPDPSMAFAYLLGWPKSLGTPRYPETQHAL